MIGKKILSEVKIMFPAVISNPLDYTRQDPYKIMAPKYHTILMHTLYIKDSDRSIIQFPKKLLALLGF